MQGVRNGDDSQADVEVVGRAESVQNLCNENRTESAPELERELEKDLHPSDEVSKSPKPPKLADEFVDAWNSTAGVRQCRSLTPKRLKSLHARIAEGAAWDWRTALGRFPLRC